MNKRKLRFRGQSEDRRNMSDYTGRIPTEVIAPRLPGQDLPPFGVTPQPSRQFMVNEILAQIGDYSKAFTDYFYVFDWSGALTLPAGGTMPIPKNMFNDQFWALMFIIIKYSTYEDADQYFNLQLTNTGLGVSYFDEPVHSQLIAGTATDPWWLPNMIIFAPNQNMQITLTNLDPDNDSYPRILLGGRRYHT